MKAREDAVETMFISLICAALPRVSLNASSSFADAVGTLRQRVQTIETFARGDVEHALVRSRKAYIGRLPRHFDRAEILAGGVEYLNAGNGRDVDPTLAIERHAVGDALLAFRDVAQLREGPLVLYAAVGLHVIGVVGRVQRVVDDEGLAVAGQREPVGPGDLVVDHDRLLGAGRQVIDVGGAAGHHRPRAGIGEVDAALGIEDEIVRRQERLAFAALGDGRDRPVAAAFAGPFAVAFGPQQISLARHPKAVGAVGLLSKETDLPVGTSTVSPQ